MPGKSARYLLTTRMGRQGSQLALLVSLTKRCMAYLQGVQTYIDELVAIPEIVSKLFLEMWIRRHGVPAIIVSGRKKGIPE